MEQSFDLHKFLELLGRDARTLEMLRLIVNQSYIRVVNYHNTNRSHRARLEQEISYYSKHFSPVTIKDLDYFFETKKWPYEKPGLIPAIFEGYRSHYDIMAPILDKYNFTGWFYIPSFFLDVAKEEQISYCKSHRLRQKGEEMYTDGRIALNWDEARDLSKRHEICCHTGSHFEITKETAPQDMQREIVDAKRRLEQQLQKPVDVFCWLAGEEYNYNAKTHPYLKEAEYRYVVSNLKIEKI